MPLIDERQSNMAASFMEIFASRMARASDRKPAVKKMRVQATTLAEQKRRIMNSEWLTASEAAHHLKVKPRTLLLWARQGKVPAHRLSGVRRCVWRFLRSELDAMLTPSSAGAAQEEAC
jgi:excisionase family DNA binding protein